MTSEEEDALIGKPVYTDLNDTGILLAIYENGYETTVGVTTKIAPSEYPATYLSNYAQHLPVDWHNRKWAFPDGKLGTLCVDWFASQQVFTRVEDGTGWGAVTEVT